MLSISALSKSYPNHEALKQIDLHLQEGKMLGLLGPNGAGKTTLINILSGLSKKDAGTISLFNKEIATTDLHYKQSIGVVPQEISLYQDLSAYQNLLFWGSLYGLKKSVCKEKTDRILQDLGLYDRRHDLVKTYSGGMKRRINIGAALLHDPSLIFMDEPTVGIDPQSRNLIYNYIEKLKQSGKTILYTTHYLEEAENLCDRIAILDNGKIIVQGTLDELRTISKIQESVEILLYPTELPVDIAAISAEYQHLFSFYLKDHALTISGSGIVEAIPDLLSTMINQSLKIKKIEIKRINLENIFLQFTGYQLRD